jgi:selT/selW/selH-like putative selenoprotein
LAAELSRRFGAEVDLVEGARGAFEIKVDGQLVFSKTTEGRFPEVGEIITHFQ